MSLIEEQTDSDVIKLIIDGDINKFSIIVNRYEKKLLKYILTKTNISKEDAESLLQDAFIKVYKNLNAYNSSYTFNSWIYKITHNLIIDNYKKIESKKGQVLSLDGVIDENDNDNTLLDLLEDKNANISDKIKLKELKKQILTIINKLDDKYKEVIILRYLEGLKYDEISDVLQIPYNTVGTLVNRAKKQMKKLAIENKLDEYL